VGLLILLLALALILPGMVDLAPMKEKVLADIAQTVGGDVDCEGVRLSVFPRPRVLVHGGRLSVPGQLMGEVESVAVYPKILPLLTAKVRLAKVLLEAPAFTVNLPERLQESKERQEESPPATVDEKMASVFAVIASKAPGLAVEVKKGILNIDQENQSLLTLQNMKGHISLPPGSVKVDVSCKSNLWESLSLKGSWDLQRNQEPVTEQTPPLLSLEVEGKGVNGQTTREAALTLAGNIPAIRDVFRVVQGGEVPRITFRSQGHRLADLGKMANIVIAGTMMDGRVSVPGADLELEEVRGEVVISGGILKGKNLEARLGNSRGHNGILTLGLIGEDAPFHLDIAIEADLAQLSAFLEKQIENESFVKEIGLIDEVQGSGTGRLVLGESTASIKTQVDVGIFNLTAKYQRIPYGLEIMGGPFSYDETGIRVENLNGKVGASSFAKLSAALDLGKEPYLEVTSGELGISLDEIYPWLASFEELGKAVKDIGSVAGAITLSQLSGKGPLSRPKEWHFTTTGEVKGLAVETSLLAGPVEVVKGGFHAVEDGTKQELSLTEAQLGVLDASLKASGVLRDYLKGLNGADLSLEGEMGSESIEWFSRVMGMSPLLKPRSPLSISNGHLTYSRNAAASFAGDLVVQMGPKVTIDILKQDEELNIRNMHVQDQDTSATLKLHVSRQALNLEFSGYLTKATMNRLFEEEEAAQGWLEGDMLIRFQRGEPAESKAYGELKGGDLLLPFGVKGPLEIDSISLDAKEGALRVNSVDCMWENNRIEAKGGVRFANEGLLIDMDLSTKNLDWKTIANAFGRSSETEKAGGLAFPIGGKVRLDVGRFTYDPFVWTPFHADIAFTQDAIDVAISEANLCSIATPGTLRITPHDISLDFKPVATNQDLDPASACFLEKAKQMTGDFSFAGEITAQERPEALLESARGNLEFVANDGRIYRYAGVLAKVLAFVNVTEVFRGKLSSLAKEGLPYDSMEVEALVEDGKLVMKKGLIMGPSVEIACVGAVDLINKKYDLTYLVAPLKTVDSVAKRIPVLGRVLGGTIVSIPVKVTGDWSNPKIRALSASAVGSRLLGIMKNALKFPVKVIESRPSDEAKE